MSKLQEEVSKLSAAPISVSNGKDQTHHADDHFDPGACGRDTPDVGHIQVDASDANQWDVERSEQNNGSAVGSVSTTHVTGAGEGTEGNAGGLTIPHCMLVFICSYSAVFSKCAGYHTDIHVLRVYLMYD